MLDRTYAGLTLELADPGILTVTFARPQQLNGFYAAMKRDLIELLVQAQYDDRVRVVVFTGEGKAFCAGDDFAGDFWEQGWDRAQTRPVAPPVKASIGSYSSLRTISQQVNAQIRSLDKLTVAAINGAAIQSGLSLALACDFRIAADTAKLGSATLRMGFLPDEGGHHLLVEHLGVARTMDFLMRKRIVSAQEAYEMGLVNEVVPADRLAEAALALARELAEGPQVAMRLLKRAVCNAAHLTYQQAGEDIAARTAISDHHPDVNEGVAAWREKRKPRFNGD